MYFFVVDFCGKFCVVRCGHVGSSFVTTHSKLCVWQTRASATGNLGLSELKRAITTSLMTKPSYQATWYRSKNAPSREHYATKADSHECCVAYALFENADLLSWLNPHFQFFTDRSFTLFCLFYILFVLNFNHTYCIEENFQTWQRDRKSSLCKWIFS